VQNVLIADDDVAIRELLAAAVRSGGMRVVAEAGNGVDAVRLATLHRPAVAIIDLLMPWVDGFDAIREITATIPDIHIVVFSALEGADDEQLARDLGAHTYLRKGSTSPRDVVDTLNSLFA
jgi:DNA-binding NarL/FixJ family response regulator